MDWKQLAPYLGPLLIVALLARRVLRAQSPQAVKVNRLWILPAILLILTGMTLATGPRPPLLALAGFVIAVAVGGTFGWFRVHTMEFSTHEESGQAMSKASPLGALLLVGLLAFRYGMKYLLNDEGMKGTELVLFTEGGLFFSAAMMVAQNAHTWIQARKFVQVPAPVPKDQTG